MTTKLTIVCEDWRALRRNTLIGFARVRIPELRLVIHDVAVHMRGGAKWIALPGKPMMKNGELIKDHDGRPQYVTVLEFDSRAVADAFRDRCIAAVLAYAPDALDVAEAVP
jgi:hypothetical protein